MKERTERFFFFNQKLKNQSQSGKHVKWSHGCNFWYFTGTIGPIMDFDFFFFYSLETQGKNILFVCLPCTHLVFYQEPKINLCPNPLWPALILSYPTSLNPGKGEGIWLAGKERGEDVRQSLAKVLKNTFQLKFLH